MAKELAPAFQFYPKDFLADSNVMPMNAEEAGAYWLLLCHCWMDQSLPNDMDHLSALARCTPKRFTKVWLRVSKCFTLDSDNLWRHPRLEKIRREQSELRLKRSESGRLGSLGKTQNRLASAKQVLSKGEAKPSSPISYLPSPTQKVSEGGGEDFYETFRRLYAKHHHQAQLPLQPKGRDIDTIVELVTTYPDAAHLAEMVELFFLYQHKDLVGKPRSLGLFRYYASTMDGELRRAGRVPA